MSEEKSKVEEQPAVEQAKIGLGQTEERSDEEEVKYAEDLHTGSQGFDKDVSEKYPS